MKKGVRLIVVCIVVLLIVVMVPVVSAGFVDFLKGLFVREKAEAESLEEVELGSSKVRLSPESQSPVLVFIEEIQITNDSNPQNNPAIYGDRIVYEDFRNGNYDIYLYDLSTGNETQITSDLNTQRNSDIHGNRVVYTDNRNGNSDIYMHDLSTGGETQITSDLNTQRNPVIYGDIIVWEDRRGGNYDIYMHDLSTGGETKIANNSNPEHHPRIYGDKIVWNDEFSIPGDARRHSYVYMHDLSAGRTTRISTASLDKYQQIYEDKIIWVSGGALYRYNLSASREVLVDPDFGGGIFDLYKNMILTVQAGVLYLYNISSGEKILLYDPSTVQNPVIYDEEKIIFDRHIDVYMARIIYNPPPPQISFINPTEVIIGSVITITGDYFGSSQGDSYVEFYSGVRGEVLSWGFKEILCKVPQGAQTGDVKVITSAGSSNGVSITVNQGSPPVVNLISPDESCNFNQEVVNFSCSATSQDNLKNMTIYIWDLFNNEIFRETKPLTGTSDSALFSYDFSSYGNYKWNCFAYDVLGYSGWGDEGNLIISKVCSGGGCFNKDVNCDGDIDVKDLVFVAQGV
jgi:beta propeller repeat protein